MLVEPWLASLLRHPLLQRLNFVRQLSFSYQDQPNASHTRLSHSLGVARFAEMAVHSMLAFDKIYVIGTSTTENFDLSADDKRKLVMLAKISGMLHDVGHGPFGHALDRYVQQLKRKSTTEVRTDKLYSADYISLHLKEVLTRIEVDSGTVSNIIDPRKLAELKGKTYFSLLASVINSDLDVDRMDYLPRDSLFNGLPLGSLSPFPLIQLMRPVKRIDPTDGISFYSIAFEDYQISLLEHAIEGRQQMYSHCYETDRKIACETMLVGAVDSFLAINRGTIDLDQIMLLRDDDLLTLMLSMSPEDTAAHRLSLHLKVGIPFQLLFKQLLSPDRGKSIPVLDAYYKELTRIDVKAESSFRLNHERNTAKTWKETICDAASLEEKDRWKVQIYLTPFELFENPEATTTILVKDGGTYDTIPLIERSKSLEAAAKTWRIQRQNIRFFVDPEMDAERKEKMKQACNELFKVL